MEEVEEEGLKISFFNEFAPGFYVNPEREDVSFPVYPDEVVVLENPEAETRNRKFGYKFNSGVKAAIEQVLGKKNE